MDGSNGLSALQRLAIPDLFPSVHLRLLDADGSLNMPINCPKSAEHPSHLCQVVYHGKVEKELYVIDLTWSLRLEVDRYGCIPYGRGPCLQQVASFIAFSLFVHPDYFGIAYI
jgi:hypothetical protein